MSKPNQFELTQVLEICLGKKYASVRILSDGGQNIWVADDLIHALGIKTIYSFYKSIPENEKIKVRVKKVGGSNRIERICIPEDRAIQIINCYDSPAAKALTKVVINYLDSLYGVNDITHTEAENLNNDSAFNEPLINIINNAQDSFTSGVKQAVQLRTQAKELLMAYTDKMLSLIGVVYKADGDRFVVKFAEGSKFPLYYYPLENHWSVEGDENKYRSTGVLDFIKKAASQTINKLSAWAAKKNDVSAFNYAKKIEVQLTAFIERIHEILEIESLENIDDSLAS